MRFVKAQVKLLEKSPVWVAAYGGRLTRTGARDIEDFEKEMERRGEGESIEGIRKYIGKIVGRYGHESVGEHVWFSFLVSDVSRLAIEYLEHFRLLSYLEMSFRVKRGGVEISEYAVENSNRRGIENMVEEYEIALQQGAKPEVARGLLPMGVVTDVVISGNMRELLYAIAHWLNANLDEVVDIAAAMLREIREEVGGWVYEYVNSIYDVEKRGVFIPFIKGYTTSDFIENELEGNRWRNGLKAYGLLFDEGVMKHITSGYGRQEEYMGRARVGDLLLVEDEENGGQVMRVSMDADRFIIGSELGGIEEFGYSWLETLKVWVNRNGFGVIGRGEEVVRTIENALGSLYLRWRKCSEDVIGEGEWYKNDGLEDALRVLDSLLDKGRDLENIQVYVNGLVPIYISDQVKRHRMFVYRSTVVGYRTRMGRVRFIEVGGDLRNWIKFLKLRLHTGAQLEVRLMSAVIAYQIAQEMYLGVLDNIFRV